MSDGRRQSGQRANWIGVIVGVLLTAICLLLSFASAGFGHGDYSFARIFYPVPMLLTRFTSNTITPISVLLAVVQFPIYGWLVERGLSEPKRFFFALAISVLVLHGAGIILCFSGAIPGLSG